MGFLGDFGGGAKIFGGNPIRNAMTADLRRLVKKLWRCSKYPSQYTLQRNYKKKHWCMWAPMGDVITHALFQLNRFRS